MKLLHLLTLRLCLAGLLLVSSATEAREDGATDCSDDAKVCKNLACHKWSDAEKFVWDQTRAGEIANFNKREKNELAPRVLV
jgi:hypothetical protein